LKAVAPRSASREGPSRLTVTQLSRDASGPHALDALP